MPFAKRTATTQLVVRDQQTVVIGGLVRSRVARTETKIPLLGDIPVLGALFRQRPSDDRPRRNLILVLTPYIIREQDDLRTVFERKMQERQEFLDRYFVFTEQNEYEPPKDYSRTNGLLEDIRQSYLRGGRAAAPRGAHAPARDQDARAGAAARAARAAGRRRRRRACRRAARPPARRQPAGGRAARRSRLRLNVTPPPRNVEKIER